MSLKKIEIEIGKLGYEYIFRESLNRLQCGIADDKTGAKLDSMFQIFEDGNSYVCMWYNRNITMEERFSTIEDLLEFVKEKFPIN